MLYLIAEVKWSPVSKRVLIVEDERLLARTLSTALQEAGYDTVVSHSAEQAERHWLGKRLFDLVILDNRLPKSSGLDLLKSVRERGVGSKVILVTAFDKRGLKSEAKRLGVDKYLRKPFDLDSILSTVTELIGPPGNGAPMNPSEGG